jgi:hypothetical protein
VVATILNGLAEAVHPANTGPFGSPFANLPYPEKTAVFQIMDNHAAFRVLAGVLPGFVAFFVYSEAGTFDPVTRSIRRSPGQSPIVGSHSAGMTRWLPRRVRATLSGPW